jgi:hypothetical protein
VSSTLPSSRGRTCRAVGAVLAGVVSAGALLSACSNGVGTSGGTGYVSGKGAVTSLPASDRKPVGPLEGTTIDGRAVSLHDYAGQVVVVNV